MSRLKSSNTDQQSNANREKPQCCCCILNILKTYCTTVFLLLFFCSFCGKCKGLKDNVTGRDKVQPAIMLWSSVYVSGRNGVGGKVMALSMWSDEHLPALHRSFRLSTSKLMSHLAHPICSFSVSHHGPVSAL